MAIIHSDGATTFTGPRSTSLFRLITMLNGLRFEIKTGMKLCRGPTCYTLAKREFGLRGNKAAVLAQLETIVEEAKAEHGPAIDERTPKCDHVRDSSIGVFCSCHETQDG